MCRWADVVTSRSLRSVASRWRPTRPGRGRTDGEDAPLVPIGEGEAAGRAHRRRVAWAMPVLALAALPLAILAPSVNGAAATHETDSRPAAPAAARVGHRASTDRGHKRHRERDGGSRTGHVRRGTHRRGIRVTRASSALDRSSRGRRPLAPPGSAPGARSTPKSPGAAAGSPRPRRRRMRRPARCRPRRPLVPERQRLW